MVSSVNFKYFDLKNINFAGIDDKCGGVILMIGENKEKKTKIVHKLQQMHNVQNIHYAIDPTYLRNKVNEVKLEREFIITDLTDANNNIDLILNAVYFRIVVFIFMHHIRKINQKLIGLMDYVFCQQIMVKEPMQFLYDNFIYMFKHDWDFFKFVFMQIKQNDWIVVHNSNKTALRPEDYIYFYK